MKIPAKDLTILAFALIGFTVALWLPHFLALPNFFGLNFSNGFNIIYRNFDGIEYIVIAKSWYSSQIIAGLPNALSPNYYASHFAGYSILIAVFAVIFGYLKSMLLVSLVSTMGCIWAFYFLVKDFKLTDKPLFLSLIFIILPARWVIVHSVGSSEPTFILFTILSIYYFMKFEKGQFNFLHLKNPPKLKKYLFFSAIFASLAQITRPPGILLFIAIMIYIHLQLLISARKIGFKKALLNHLQFYPFLLVPFTLLSIFYYYGIAYHDFFAYFNSGDNIHLTLPPFAVFNKLQSWVGDIWLEDVIYTTILGFYGTVLLFKRKLYPVAFFTLTYLTASIFVAHRDISRYILPVTPFILIGFEKVLVSKEFKIILPIIILAVYLYSQNFILANTAPIPNLIPFN